MHRITVFKIFHSYTLFHGCTIFRAKQRYTGVLTFQIQSYDKQKQHLVYAVY